MDKLINLIKNIGNKGFFHLLTANLFISIVGFGAQLFVAKILTEDQLGYIKIFQSFIQILSVIAGMGFSTSVLILAANPENEKRKFKILQTAFYATIPISIIVYLIFIFLNQFNIWTKVSEVKILFDHFSFIIIFLSLSALFTAFMQSLREFKKFSNLISFTNISTVLLIVFFTYTYKLNGFMIGLSVGCFIALIVNILFVKVKFNLTLSQKIDNLNSKIKEQFLIGIHGLGTNLFGRISANLDILILSFYLADDPQTMGQYSFAAIFIMAMSIIQGTVVSISTPYFSKHLQSPIYLRSIYKKYSLLLLFGISIIGILAFFILPVFIEFIYGSKFDKGVYFLKLLLGVWYMRSLNCINIAYLISSNNIKTTNYFNFISMVIIGLTIYFFSNYFGITIMIIAIIIISFLLLLYSVYLTQRKMVLPN